MHGLPLKYKLRSRFRTEPTADGFESRGSKCAEQVTAVWQIDSKNTADTEDARQKIPYKRLSFLALIRRFYLKNFYVMTACIEFLDFNFLCIVTGLNIIHYQYFIIEVTPIVIFFLISFFVQNCLITVNF